MKFTLNANSVETLIKKTKLFNYLVIQLKTLKGKNEDIYFKLSNNTLALFYRGARGAFKTCIEAFMENPEDVFYFSVDFSKWQTALCKLSTYSSINFDVNNHLLKLYIDGTDNEINLGVVEFAADSEEATSLESFIQGGKESISESGRSLTVDYSFLQNVQFANILPISDDYVIGFSSKEVIYADRVLILKAAFDKVYNEEFFSNLEDDEKYVKLHPSISNLLPLICGTNPKIHFSNLYDDIYWKDDDTEIYMRSDYIDMVPPTDDEFEDFKPQNGGIIETSLEVLEKGVDFFTGMYEGSSWKPLTFDCANGGVVLRYVHPTTQLKKTLDNTTCTENGKFLVEAEVLRKVIERVYTNNNKTDAEVRFEYDEDAPGVYCTVGDKYSIIFAKLGDED